MASRSSSKANTAIDQLHSLVPGSTCHYIPLDLSDLSSIKDAVDEFKKKEERLDVLFCNAGVMVPDMKDVTKQGYDLQFGTNVLGHHYLIGLLVSPTSIHSSRLALLIPSGLSDTDRPHNDSSQPHPHPHPQAQPLLNPSQTNPKEKSRIVLLSSIGHTLFPPHFENAFEPSITTRGSPRDKVGKIGLYGHSKMVSLGSAGWG